MRNRKLLLLFVFAGLGIAAVTAAVRFIGNDGGSAPASLESALAGIDRLAAEFPAPGDAALALPADHASKPDQFAESWLFAGLLHDEAGEAWGFQLAFQRIGLQVEPVQRASAWATSNIWRARLTVEPAGAPVAAEERLSRAALGLAGASASPASAWIEDWRFAADTSGGFRLQGAAADSSLALRLAAPERGPVAIERGPYRGYWWPGLAVDGTLAVDGRAFKVSGRAMLDRLWGRGLPTGRGQLAMASLWLEPDDGPALRCEQLRRRAGGGSPLTECVADRPTPVDGVQPSPADDGWRTLGGIRYPLRWVVQRGAAADALRLAPLATAEDASLDGTWSGVVTMTEGGAGWGLLQLSNFAAP